MDVLKQADKDGDALHAHHLNERKGWLRRHPEQEQAAADSAGGEEQHRRHPLHPLQRFIQLPSDNYMRIQCTQKKDLGDVVVFHKYDYVESVDTETDYKDEDKLWKIHGQSQSATQEVPRHANGHKN